MRSLFEWTVWTRQWPLRWAAAGVAACFAEWLRQAVGANTGFYPYVFAFVAVALTGFAFGRNAGTIALFISIFFAALALTPTGTFAIADEHDALGLLLYSLLTTSALIALETMHRLSSRLSEAQKAAAAAAAYAEHTEREHDILLAEFRHRVKNDLARLAATFSLRAAQASLETADALRAASSRVYLFATIYDQMALRKGVMVADMHEFLRDLVRDLNATIEREQPVGLVLQAEPHTLPFGQASAIALIVNELVTNALKHAFPGDMEGTIRIEFRRENSDYVLVVADDGIGMPSSSAESSGQGSRIVRALAAQIGGRLQTGPNAVNGTKHVLRFRASAQS